MKTPTELLQALTDHEDAESAIAVYKEANFILSQFEDVKKAALALAEASLAATGETELKTVAGSCGWTKPKAKKLDREAWQQAMLANPNLAKIQVEFEAVEINLKEAQEPFMILPAGSFFIR